MNGIEHPATIRKESHATTTTRPSRPPAEALERVLAGPAGLGSAAIRFTPPQPGDPPGRGTPAPARIEGVYCPPAVRDDRALADLINAQLLEWADGVELFRSPDLRAGLLSFDPGRSVVLCHPDAPSTEHLLTAAKLLTGENAVDDYFCEPELGGAPEGLGARLAVAQSAIDPTHMPAPYDAHWRAALAGHPALRCMHAAMESLNRLATPAQAHRFRHEIASLYLGYEAEGACVQEERTPPVWEYLVQRQLNSFRPCLAITDAIGGYELPAELFALPAVQRATALASTASTVLNDLYSLRKEQASGRFHYSLPTVIAQEEDCAIDDAFAKAIDVHNDLVRAFETEAAALAAHPLTARYVTGLANWMGGNHEWHAGHVGGRYATSP
ncbi:family 2 encapsulin nanocompartment cargo protein terpene cyclase [Streptomyces sp. SPB162]|uniref:family 2 encapsulin nanocompartment cargo protein terpene cyclase n=1 Tax=Streptomyces sp. SPB162 TaxID=2940560 RepID=UPI002406DC71|nr:family 2 encapsulin nanocompartment cargo protein terpene cyclase [Streptomyces sp. SPB162]